MEMAGLSSPDELAMLDGSPPCQGVSMAGKNRINDGRNQLLDNAMCSGFLWSRLRMVFVGAREDLLFQNSSALNSIPIIYICRQILLWHPANR
jgi:hypothetical protein